MSAPGSTRLLIAGTSGLLASFVAFLCCVLPLGSIALGAVGLGAAAHVVGTSLDLAALPLAIVSVALIVAGLRRRWTERTRA